MTATGAVIVGAKTRGWTKRSISSARPGTPNSAANRAALKQMDECQLACGLTREQVDAFHAAERARVRARYGLAA